MGSLDSVSRDQNIILFDGVCNLCSGLVQFIIKHDKRNRFRFASLQSVFGKKQLEYHGLDSSQVQSIVLLQTNRVLQQSDAVLEIVKNLNGGWSILYGLIIIPRFIRDIVYRFVARIRYRTFGKKDACWIPTPELKHRFLE